MNIYLCGPMSGYPEHNYPAFHEAAAQLRKRGHHVLNPAEVSPAEGVPYRACMAVDLAWICAQADAIVALPGWEQSTGAFAEMALARALCIRWAYWVRDELVWPAYWPDMKVTGA